MLDVSTPFGHLRMYKMDTMVYIERADCFCKSTWILTTAKSSFNYNTCQDFFCFMSHAHIDALEFADRCHENSETSVPLHRTWSLRALHNSNEWRVLNRFKVGCNLLSRLQDSPHSGHNLVPTMDGAWQRLTAELFLTLRMKCFVLIFWELYLSLQLIVWGRACRGKRNTVYRHQNFRPAPS